LSRLKFLQNRFQLSAGLNLEKLNTIRPLKYESKLGILKYTRNLEVYLERRKQLGILEYTRNLEVYLERRKQLGILEYTRNLEVYLERRK